MRVTCYRCFRPVDFCVCNLVSPFRAHLDVLVIQHPHEARKYYSTVKILRACISNLELLRGIEFPDGDLEGKFSERSPYLLYPRPGCVTCESVALPKNALLVVLDGTWSEAGKIFRRNPLLSTLPALSFGTAFSSNYGIRKQPRAGCLSTLEALAFAIEQTARGVGQVAARQQANSLREGLATMVEAQLQYFPRFSSGLPPEMLSSRR